MMNFQKILYISERALIAIGMLKVLLLAFFFASFLAIDEGSAESSADVCTGTDLLAELEREKPETFEKISAEASETINGNGIFWKVEKEGVEPSWLYGTMHLSDPQISKIPEDAEAAIRDSDTVVIETLDILDQQAAARAMGQLAHLTFLTEGTLRDFIDDDLEDELEQALVSRGVPMALADRMRPWLIATTIALPTCEFERKREGDVVLDQALAEFAQANGKELVGLETMAEQFSAMASLPHDYHVAALEETLASGSLIQDMFATMKQLYKDENIGIIFPLMKAAMPRSGNSQGTAEFQELLIDKRNQVMIDRSLELVANGPTFIAVGALHLPGEQGLVNLFRKHGYTVTAQR